MVGRIGIHKRLLFSNINNGRRIKIYGGGMCFGDVLGVNRGGWIMDMDENVVGKWMNMDEN